MLLLAHRGASAAAPENTLAAFREAVRQGADGVELDVQRCASGELVVCHDETLERLAGRTWNVARTPWRKLQHAEVGTRLGYAEQHIPLLEEVFEALPDDFVVNVELKCEALDDQGLAEEAGEWVTRSGRANQVVFSSFNPLCLLRLSRAFPALRRGYLLDPDRSYLLHGEVIASAVASFSLHPHHTRCTPARVKRWHQRGWKVATWTVDDVGEARRLQALGIDYLITNTPAAVRAGLESKGRRGPVGR